MSKKDEKPGLVDKAKSAAGRTVGKVVEVAGEAASAAGKVLEVAGQVAGGRANRTGIGMSPIHGPRTVEGARDAIPSSPGDVNALSSVRVSYAREAEPMGTVPPPSTPRGVAQTARSALEGAKAPFLLDKLGERLAFERTGVRLYEELLLAFDAHGSFPGGPTREQLEVARSEEAAHFNVVRDAILELGGDPTAVTPSANVVAVESMGLLQVLSDPRRSLADGLHAMLVAELADHDGWDMLIRLTLEAKQDDLVTRFRAALVDEEKHLGWVRSWLEANATNEVAVGKRRQDAAARRNETHAPD